MSLVLDRPEITAQFTQGKSQLTDVVAALETQDPR